MQSSSRAQDDVVECYDGLHLYTSSSHSFIGERTPSVRNTSCLLMRKQRKRNVQACKHSHIHVCVCTFYLRTNIPTNVPVHRLFIHTERPSLDCILVSIPSLYIDLQEEVSLVFSVFLLLYFLSHPHAQRPHGRKLNIGAFRKIFSVHQRPM